MKNQYAKRVDQNQAEIIEGLELAGYRYWLTFRLGGGFPDLLVASKTGLNVLMEIKMPKEQLTPAEQTFHAEWPNRVEIVHTAEEAIHVMEYYDTFNLKRRI